MACLYLINKIYLLVNFLELTLQSLLAKVEEVILPIHKLIFSQYFICAIGYSSIRLSVKSDVAELFGIEF